MMLTVAVCIGSSCYLRGSEQIAAKFDELITVGGLSEAVEIVGSLCMEACAMGVSVRVGDDIFHGLTPEGAESFFAQEIAPRI